MTMKRVSSSLAAVVALLLAAAASGEEDAQRGSYSYIRTLTGEAVVASEWNGNVDARRNMPISVGDEISVSQGGRVEIGLADGNVLFLGGGSRAAFESLYDQQGEDDQFSAIRLSDGDVMLTAMGSNQDRIPRIDTDDATVYLSAGARVRVNSDSRRGTVVIGRAGTAEVRTRTGTYTVKAGQYLMVRGDEEPETARGSFSRDRFDIWVADRLETLDDSRGVSARYVGEEASGDVAALDGYGDWDYDASYGGNVWSPRVDADWSPYSQGSWYYTPAGLTWWSNDPWGWYPFHYGNWFFASARNRWCWAPASVYSPAWVYWGYSPGFVGWCPTGYYSFFSPWLDTYYRRWGFPSRSNLYFSVHGTFPTRQVDFHGWNFTQAGSFGAARARLDVIPGSRMTDRLGAQVAISSHPIVVNPREGGVREAIRTYVREAPRTIERTAGPDSQLLGPVLARERSLPADTQSALRDRAVVAERGRLAGRTASEISPRGAIVERARGVASAGTGREAVTAERWRGVPDQGGSPGAASRDRAAVLGGDRAQPRVAPRADDSWRSRGDAASRERSASPERSRDASRPGSTDSRPSGAPPAGPSSGSRAESWRSRDDTPPARRVIEGAVPGRARDSRFENMPRPAGVPPERGWRTREAPAPRDRDFRSESEAPRTERAPAPRAERPPAYAPPPRVERAPASSAPPPRSESRREAPPQRSAPAPQHERGRRD
jgi:FecR protein